MKVFPGFSAETMSAQGLPVRVACVGSRSVDRAELPHRGQVQGVCLRLVAVGLDVQV